MGYSVEWLMVSYLYMITFFVIPWCLSKWQSEAISTIFCIKNNVLVVVTLYGEPILVSTELFKFSVWGGFPGLEKELVLGRNIVDASCGSGLFSRRFAKSGPFSVVVALTYSENMLKQFYEFIEQEGDFPKSAVAKISRVLRLGGVFVPTTYILDGPFGQISDSFIFLSEWELEDLCKAYGLVGFTCIRNGAFVMISATKPT
ncbi:hypothetical protein UlMin_018498 [Ulmus minor]